MPIPPEIVRCYKYIDLNSKRYIQELKELVKIPNVSQDIGAKKHLTTVIMSMVDRLRELDFSVIVKQPEQAKYKDNMPAPVILATLGTNPKKRTLLYYCHLDVLKVQREEWKTDPFELTEKDGKLYGRGTAKMKGPILCFIHAVECYRNLGIEMPINIKILCESSYEVKSRGLRVVLEELKGTFLSNIDCVLLTESCWLGRDYPCIVYGMRGVCYFNVVIEGPKKDLDSGDYGGVVREPMQDLVYILLSLADPYGKMNAPHFYDGLVEVTPDEEEFYKKIKIEVSEYRKNVGVNRLDHNENLKLVLMHVWRLPWFNLHFVNTPCDNQNLLDIPRKLVARFSIRTVPNQTHGKVSMSVLSYIKTLIKESKTPNKIKITLGDEYPLDPWYENHLHWNYEAANKATKQVYKEEASFIREGNGFPTLLKLRDALPGRNILMLPIVNCESKTHGVGENISIRCYIEGTKLLVSYFTELREASKRHAKLKKQGRQTDLCRYTL